jgi:hypothetical protein
VKRFYGDSLKNDASGPPGFWYYFLNALKMQSNLRLYAQTDPATEYRHVPKKSQDPMIWQAHP